MQYVVTGKEMKAIDEYSIHQIGIPSLVLMERAAHALCTSIAEKENKDASIGIVAGTGNNGADGLAAARILQEKGFSRIRVWVAGNRDHATEEWEIQYQIVRKLGIPVCLNWTGEDSALSSCGVLVDCLFGTGLSREVTGVYRTVIGAINASPAKVYAADIPSGISAENGRKMGVAVKADITVTFGFLKAGCILYPGAEYSGNVEVHPIGFPRLALEQICHSFVIYGEEDKSRMPVRPKHSNKGTFGKVLLVAGSPNMAGAACFAAGAAYACGAGLVRILTARENREILQTQIPEAILTTWESGREQLYYEDIVRQCCSQATVVAAGPGLGTSKEAAFLCEALLREWKGPLVLDADGLNLLAQHPQWGEESCGNWILTPHPGELARLLGIETAQAAENLLECAEQLANRYRAVAVCKDARTIVESGSVPTYINVSGNSAMAKAGSGDVLAGILAGLLVQQKDSKRAACLGTYLHGRCGDLAREEKGPYSVLARDLLEHIGPAFGELIEYCSKEKEEWI